MFDSLHLLLRPDRLGIHVADRALAGHCAFGCARRRCKGNRKRIELRQLSNQWAKAFTHHDVAFGQRIFADDFTYIMPDGTERNKNAFLKLFRTETAGKTYTSVAITGFNVRVYGPDFAVVTGTDQLKGADKDGKPFSVKGRFTNVWVRKKGTWQVVAGHGCLIE